MGVITNGTYCNKCKQEFCVVLEWKGKEEAIKEIEKTKCPKCGSEDWSFTDDIGQ